MTITMIGVEQLALPFDEVKPKRKKPLSMWERIGHLPNEWDPFHAKAVEANANRVRPKRHTTLTPSYLSEHPDFDHDGPPPPDGRCACGNKLKRCSGPLGYERYFGYWQCYGCGTGYCSWSDCKGRGEYLRRDGGGKECHKHHCGWCSTPGCDDWATGNIVDRAYVCVGCYRGLCACGKPAASRFDGVPKCRSCAQRVCTEPGCGSQGLNRDADGKLRCHRHQHGICEVHGCDSPANSSHGLCGAHRANGVEWVSRKTVREGHGYVYAYDIHHASNGRWTGVGYGHIHHTTVRGTFRAYDKNLAAEGLRRGKTLLLELPEVSMAKSDDTKIRQFIPGRTLEQKTGKTVKRLKNESNCDVKLFDLVSQADANEHINIRMFASFDSDEWACKWMSLDEEYNLVHYGSDTRAA